MDAYLRTFRWNKVKYRAERPLSELMDVLQKVRLVNMRSMLYN